MVAASGKEFLAMIMPSDRYQVLAELMKEMELTHEARLAAESAYFASAVKKAPP